MPTYFCYAKPGVLDSGDRAALAARITSVHSTETGAPASFTQVIFPEIGAEGFHFIGGLPADSGTVFVHGSIREGRSAETKARLITALRDLVVQVTGIAAELVWVYLVELAPQQMIEFGQVLPAAGEEQAWLETLPADLRHRLRSFEAAAGGDAG